MVIGRKSIELRNWNTSYRGRFLVHSAKQQYEGYASTYGLDQEELATGAIIGYADIYGVKSYRDKEDFDKDKNKHLASGKFMFSKYAFMLRNAGKLEKPIKTKGKLNFFEVNIEV